MIFVSCGLLGKPLGNLLGRLGGLLGRLEAILGDLGRFGGVSGLLGAVLGRFQVRVAATWAVLELSCHRGAILGASWAVLG
eukprot:6109588-Pyramimonas_sp.AAC.1